MLCCLCLNNREEFVVLVGEECIIVVPYIPETIAEHFGPALMGLHMKMIRVSSLLLFS